MSIRRAHLLVLPLSLAACPDPGASTGSSSGTTDGGAGSSSTGDTADVPTTDTTTDTAAETSTGTPTSEPSTSSTGTTTDDTTTGGVSGVARVLYHPFIEHLGQPSASAARYVEIVDGVAMPPVTLVDPPGPRLVTVDATPDRRWSPYHTPADAAPQLWLVDMQTLTPHEIALPAEVERVVQARLSRDDTHLILWTAPQDSMDGADYEYHLCELGAAAECTLERVEPATGPTTYVAQIHDISSATGRIWYSTREIDGTTRTELQGDVAAPEAAEPIAMFSDDGGLAFVSIDEQTAYFIRSGGAELLGMDIGGDAPGPLVEIHPPMPDVRRRWSADEKDLLLHAGGGLYGDLFHLTVDGTKAGPVVQIDAGGPSHVRSKPLEWISGRRVLFLGDQDSPTQAQLYMADVAAPAAPPVRLSGPLQATGEVNDWHMRGDPEHVTYYAQQADKTPSELYRVRLDAPGQAHKLNGPLADGTFLLGGAFSASADGARVVYAGSEVEGRLDLFLVEFDGEVPLAPVNLTSGLPRGTEVSLLGHLGPDAAQVFFASRVDGERGPLYMVPLSPQIGPPVPISSDGEQVYNYSVLAAE